MGQAEFHHLFLPQLPQSFPRLPWSIDFKLIFVYNSCMEKALNKVPGPTLPGGGF